MFGDAPDDSPSIGRFNLQAKWMFSAWTEYKGWSAEDAMTEFVDTCKNILEKNGYSWEDPRKEIMTAAYEKCIEESEMVSSVEPILFSATITPEPLPDEQI